MTAGTFLGAIWANVSWGRYWGWDPKETWALISIVVYALVLHIRFIPLLKGKTTWCFNLLSVVAVLSVIMTWFGVNYYLSGLHSYGKTEVDMGIGRMPRTCFSVVCPQTFKETLCHIFVFLLSIIREETKMWQII